MQYAHQSWCLIANPAHTQISLRSIATPSISYCADEAGHTECRGHAVAVLDRVWKHSELRHPC